MNILLKEVFAGIFVSIACWNRHYDFLESSDKSSKFNSFAFTLSAVILACHWWYKLFIHLWMKGIYFASFYFRVWDLTREIRENKNPAKISTYTVHYDVSLYQRIIMWINFAAQYVHVLLIARRGQKVNRIDLYRKEKDIDWGALSHDLSQEWWR